MLAGSAEFKNELQVLFLFVVVLSRKSMRIVYALLSEHLACTKPDYTRAFVVGEPLSNRALFAMSLLPWGLMIFDGVVLQPRQIVTMPFFL